MIYGFQQSAYDKLLSITRAQLSGKLRHAGINARTNILLVAHSGSGKTHLSAEVAKELKVSYLKINISEWLLLGSASKSGQVTWTMILNTLLKERSKHGLVLFIDELDKVGMQGQGQTGGSSWDSHLINELYLLLDKSIPRGLTNENAVPIPDVLIDEAQKRLRTSTQIIGAGAFQSTWTEREAAQIGFTSSTGGMNTGVLALPDLWKTIPQELANRFRRDLAIIPNPSIDDYRDMLVHSACRLPEDLAKVFLDLGEANLADAMISRQGARYVEELLVDSVIAHGEMQSMKPLDTNPIINFKTASVI